MRVLFVRRPVDGIVPDILPNPIQFSLVPNDTLVVIALPDWCRRFGMKTIDALRDDGFELTDDRAQRPFSRIRRGGPVARPRVRRNGWGYYGIAKPDNPMKMVRHANKFIQPHRGSHGLGLPPFLFHDRPIPRILEEQCALIRANRHEIGPCSGITDPFQPDGFAVVNISVVRHPSPKYQIRASHRPAPTCIDPCRRRGGPVARPFIHPSITSRNARRNGDDPISARSHGDWPPG